MKLEAKLAEYLTECALLNHGLTTFETRQLSFLYAKANCVKVPNGWLPKEKATKD